MQQPAAAALKIVHELSMPMNSRVKSFLDAYNRHGYAVGR